MATSTSDEIGAEVLQNGQNKREEAAVNGEGAATTAEEAEGEAEGTTEGKQTAEEADEAKAADNGGESSADDRAFGGAKTPPASQLRQTPPLSANIRAPTVRKRCSAVFGAKASHSSSASGGGGLSALTSAMLGKKPRKQSVLDNAESGWRAFVREERLEQELESHMRSKDAYLDKQEFLLRADHSQFERERELRAHDRRIQQQQQAANNGGNKPR